MSQQLIAFPKLPNSFNEYINFDFSFYFRLWSFNEELLHRYHDKPYSDLMLFLGYVDVGCGGHFLSYRNGRVLAVSKNDLISNSWPSMYLNKNMTVYKKAGMSRYHVEWYNDTTESKEHQDQLTEDHPRNDIEYINIDATTSSSQC